MGTGSRDAPWAGLAVVVLALVLLVSIAIRRCAAWVVSCCASPAPSVLYGSTGFEIQEVEPVALGPSPERSG